MLEWPPTVIAYEFHKAEAKRLRAEAVDGLFSRIVRLVVTRRPVEESRRPTPALRLVTR